MVVPTVIMALLALTLVVIAVRKGDGSHLQGLNATWRMTLQVLPLLVFAFTVAGMVQVLIPREALAKWIGTESGWRGIMLGSVTGGLMPGGPYVCLPIAASIMNAGAGIGTMVALLTGWSLWAVSRLPLEVGIMGWRFTVIRFTCTLVFPPLAGFIAQMFFSGKL